MSVRDAAGSYTDCKEQMVCLAEVFSSSCLKCLREHDPQQTVPIVCDASSMCRMQQELHRLQGAERVLKRNLQLQLPEEFRKVTRRVEELEKANSALKAKMSSSSTMKSEDFEEKVRKIEAQEENKELKR